MAVIALLRILAVVAGIALAAIAAAAEDAATAAPVCTRLKHTPPHTPCGLNGYIISPLNPEYQDLAANSSTPDLATCLKFCYNRSYYPGSPNIDQYACGGFGYNAASGQCQIFGPRGKYFAKNIRPDKQSPVKYYSMECFHCPQLQCPDHRDINLIDNSGFEMSDTLYGPWFPDDESKQFHPSIVSPGHLSDHALLLLGNVAQIRNVCPGQIYSFSADVKLINATVQGGVKGAVLEFAAGELDIHKKIAGEGAGKWHTVQGTFKGALKGYFDPFPRFTTFIDFAQNSPFVAGNEVHVDNFVVKPTTTSTYNTTGPSLVTNGGFEDGVLEPWNLKIDTYDQRTTVGVFKGEGLTPDSQYAFYYNAEPDISYDPQYLGVDSAGIVLTQNITTVPDQLYQLSVDFRTNHTSDVSISLGAYTWYVFAGEYYVNYDGSDQYVVPISNKTMSFSRVFKGEEGANQKLLSISIYLFDYYQPSNETIVVDNVSVLALADGQSV